jgi:hypothetical protein
MPVLLRFPTRLSSAPFTYPGALSSVVYQCMAQEVETLRKHNLGLHEVVPFEGTKARLASFLDDFLAAHDVVTVQNPPMTPDHIAWNQDQLFDVMYLLRGEPRMRQSTQIAFTAEYVSNLQVVLNLSVADCTMENRFIYYVLANHDALHDVYEEGMHLRFQKLLADNSSFNLTVRLCLAVALAAHMSQGTRCVRLAAAHAGIDCR